MNNLASRTDEELVVLYSKGNNEAFDILLNRYKNRIYSYIYYRSDDLSDLALDQESERPEEIQRKRR